ncbi:MAG: glycerol-3-phosphate 1-O-acyltransferase PlsY [Deltaproteobacteria bacterium]|nr:glycerol-3-phosphate 1-O-acyltransferase PlsY [Deltaproteobacteria bacterium]
MPIVLNILALIPFYLCGTIPTGHLVAKHHGVPIEGEGSGNVGATNVARVLGKKAGLLTLTGDILKGFLAASLAGLISDNAAFIAAASVAVVAGHCFSIPGKLKGGKGVATALGALLHLSPVSALLGLAVFAVVFSAFRYVSLASVAAALTAPIYGILGQNIRTTNIAIILISLLVTFRHKDNLQRLSAGKEPKFKARELLQK